MEAEKSISGKSYLWALSFMLPYKRKIAFFIASGIIVVCIEVLTPKLIQYMIDQVIPNNNTKIFILLLSALVVVNLIVLVVKTRRNLWHQTIGELASRDMQLGIFKHLRKLGFAYYEQHPAGETLSMFNSEVTSVQRIYRMFLPGIIDDSMYVVTALVLLTGINGWMSLIVLPTFVLYYWIGPYFERKASLYGVLSGEQRVVFNQRIYESISGLREFRAFGSQAWYHRHISDIHKQWSRVYLSATVFVFALDGFRRLIFYMGVVVLFVLGYHFLKNNWISLGGFVAFILLYMSAMFKYTILVTQLTEQRLVIDQTAPLYKFMHQPVEIENPSQPIELTEVYGGVIFEHVSFGYPERPLIIDDFNLVIAPGEKVAFVGASGSGKSTLFKLLGRFYDPMSGEIRLDGLPIRQFSLEQLRESIGYVFQETYLFGCSIKDNIRFGKPEATDDEIIAAAKAAYAHEFIIQLPECYETLIGERGLKLSGGQKQRIAIARMFVKKPVIVLFDEATSSLDNISEWEVQRAFNDVLASKTIIAIAHRLSTVKYFDKIVVIHEGKVVEMGRYDELLERKGFLYRLESGSDVLLEGDRQHEVS